MPGPDRLTMGNCYFLPFCLVSEKLLSLNMKQLPLVFIALMMSPFFLFGQMEPPSTVNVYNEDGGIQMVISYDPACACKTFTEYYGDGKILAKRTFRKEGRKEKVDGEDIEYFRNGAIKSYRLWKDALPVGRFYFKHENGTLAREEFYHNQCKSGTWRTFDTTGNLIKEQVFSEGKTPWNSTLDHCLTRIYNQRKLVATEVYVNGRKSVTRITDSSVFKWPVLPSSGDKLFQLKCKACHQAEQTFGPSLQGVVVRRPESWLRSMIVNGQNLISSGDSVAFSLAARYNNMKHPNFEKLSGEQIDALVTYLKTLK